MLSHPWCHRRRLAGLGAACLSLAAACSSDSSTEPTRDDAALAVTVFTHLADSVSRAGGDADVGGAYTSLAEAVRQGGRILPIVITVDGVPATFLATAQQTEIAVSPCGGDPKCFAPGRLTILRTLIAWQKDDPRKVVQLSSASDTDPIRAYLFPLLVPYTGPSASLIYFDGKGGTFFGTSGSQKFGVTTSTVACTTANPSKPTIAIVPAPAKCTQADFSITFSGKAEPSSFLTRKNTATGSHSFSMSAQPVLGARFELAAPVPPVPPIKVTPSAALPATLAAKVDNVVTLTLTVSNPSSTPVQVIFGSGQEFDFTMSATTGAPLWRWSTNVLFTRAMSTKTIPPNGSLVYSGTWLKPTRLGPMIATGSLVSLSHRADVKMMVSVP